MITVIDAVNYYRGDNFINGKHETHHTHICFSEMAQSFYTAYASDVRTGDSICTIKFYNEYVDEMSKAEWMKPKAEAKPIFTKAMADNSEWPSSDMELLVTLDNSPQAKGRIEYTNDNGFLFRYSENELNYFVSFDVTVTFKPITPPKTDKEKALDDMAEQLDNEGIFTYDQAILKILIEKIKGDKIHGMVWVGK